jgi:hypothetical protein
MGDWWDIDDEILGCLGQGCTTPADVARELGIAEGAVISLLARLALEGRVRILGVAAATPGVADPGDAGLAVPAAR